jgi:hypothetical protein
MIVNSISTGYPLTLTFFDKSCKRGFDNALLFALALLASRASSKSHQVWFDR